MAVDKLELRASQVSDFIYSNEILIACENA